LNESTYSSSSSTSSFVDGGVAGFEGESSSAHTQTREGSPPDDGLGLQQQHKQEADATDEVSPPELPDVAVRLLRDRLNVTSPGSWPTVWNVAYSAFANTRVAHDLSPSEHLVSYLARCADEPSVPRPHVWLRWYVEDRAKHLTTLDAITVAGQHEDPQEREDRFNRRLPPDWDSPTTTTSSEGDAQRLEQLPSLFIEVRVDVRRGAGGCPHIALGAVVVTVFADFVPVDPGRGDDVARLAARVALQQHRLLGAGANRQ